MAQNTPRFAPITLAECFARLMEVKHPLGYTAEEVLEDKGIFLSGVGAFVYLQDQIVEKEKTELSAAAYKRLRTEVEDLEKEVIVEFLDHTVAAYNAHDVVMKAKGGLND